MTAKIVDIHDYLSMLPPDEHHDEPCPVIVLPTIRVEKCPHGHHDAHDDLPSDVQP